MMLLVPGGWVTDWITRDRLRRALAAAPPDAAGVAALGGPLISGASYRTHAERASLAPSAELLEHAGGSVSGAVLARTEVAARVVDGRVEVDGRVLVAPGAHGHDVAGEIGPIEAADPAGRSPFPVRPVVAFLSVEAAPDPWVVGLVNGLVESGVEARVVAPVLPVGPHLTRPCSATPDSITALGPDTIVMLDDGARAVAADWCGSYRSTTLVDIDPHLESDVVLVDWQIGRASGRLRARVRPAVDVATLASLTSRLAAGPQPLPPAVER